MRSNSHLPVLRLLLIPFIVYHSPSDGVEQPLSSHSGSTQDLGLWAVLLCYVLLLTQYSKKRVYSYYNGDDKGNWCTACCTIFLQDLELHRFSGDRLSGTGKNP